MRQLKFRFWNPSTGEMSFSHDDATIWQGMLVCEGDTVAMRFTGLQKDGIDIYEDDIMEYLLEDGSIERGVVRFSSAGYWTSQPEGHSEELLHDELESDAFESKICGNIFEHRHLLEK